MTSTAWQGPTVTALCGRCGTPATIPDPTVLPDDRDACRGHCTTCGRLVEWTVWDGPVRPR